MGQYGAPTADADDASLMDFKITESYQTEFMGRWTPRLSIGAKGKCDTSGNCYFSYFGKKVTEPNMIVVDTDYDTYTIMYSSTPPTTRRPSGSTRGTPRCPTTPSTPCLQRLRQRFLALTGPRWMLAHTRMMAPTASTGT